MDNVYQYERLPYELGVRGEALDVKVDGYLPISDTVPGVNLFNGGEEVRFLGKIGKRLHCAPQVSRALEMS